MRKFLFVICLFGAGLILGSVVNSLAEDSSSTTPGSVHDPLVTKSYVDEKIAELAQGGIPSRGNQQGQQEEDEGYEIVTLRDGMKLHAGKGTELIVRNGPTYVFSDSPDGIADVTNGQDVKDGELVENNHLLINPVKGRGIQPREGITGTIFVMIRGEYEIQEEASSE